MTDGKELASRRKIAIYDLDGTFLSRATFTPFLLFAAVRHAKWRLIFTPAWIGAMIAYKAGFFTRERLKQLGLSLFTGSINQAELATISDEFADRVIPGWIGKGAAEAFTRDREEGRLLVLATAAMEFYSTGIARRAGFDEVLATRSEVVDGRCLIRGGNNYGPNKVPRVESMLAAMGLVREDCEIRFYSDSMADAPLLDWSDEAVFVNGGPGKNARALARGWQVADFR